MLNFLIFSFIKYFIPNSEREQPNAVVFMVSRGFVEGPAKTIIKLIEQRRELQAAIIEFGKCYEAPHTHMKASGNDDIRIFLFLHIYSNHRVTRLYRGTANVVH